MGSVRPRAPNQGIVSRPSGGNSFICHQEVKELFVSPYGLAETMVFHPFSSFLRGKGLSEKFCHPLVAHSAFCPGRSLYPLGLGWCVAHKTHTPNSIQEEAVQSWDNKVVPAVTGGALLGGALGKRVIFCDFLLPGLHSRGFN